MRERDHGRLYADPNDHDVGLDPFARFEPHGSCASVGTCNTCDSGAETNFDAVVTVKLLEVARHRLPRNTRQNAIEGFQNDD